MKKFFSFAVLAMAMCFGMTACGKEDGESGGTDDVQSVIRDKVWVKDGNKNGYVKFYRNHMVELSGGSSTASGALAGGESLFFGEWSASGDKLMSSFSTGSYGGVDLKNMLYGTLTLTENIDGAVLTFKERNEREHTLLKKKVFKDYTDDSEHDGALHGVWSDVVYVNNIECVATMTVRTNGTAHFTIEGADIDFDTTYSTKNGCVKFEGYLLPDNRTEFLYTREDDRVSFYTTDKAVNAWKWDKV